MTRQCDFSTTLRKCCDQLSCKIFPILYSQRTSFLFRSVSSSLPLNFYYLCLAGVIDYYYYYCRDNADGYDDLLNANLCDFLKKKKMEDQSFIDGRAMHSLLKLLIRHWATVAE
jgi:hypothetical protein